MKTISKCISAVLFRLTGSIGKSTDQDSLSDKLKTNRLLQACRHDPTKKYSTKRSGIKLNHKPKWFVPFTRMAGYSLFILFSANSFLTTTAQAASIVETFKPLESQFHKEYKSDIYEVWVKKIFPDQPLTELDGVPVLEETFNPKAEGFKYSFTYKSINDIKSDKDDAQSQCYQYYYNHPDPGPENPTTDSGKDPDSKLDPYPIQFRSESFPDKDTTHCGVSDSRKSLYKKAYEVMSHSNNWTTFDVGNSDQNSNQGAVRIYIQLNSQHKYSNQNMEYDIRPKHYVSADESLALGSNNKYIKVRKFGEEYIQPNSIKRLKKVLVLDVLQPLGTKWSGQFNISFNDKETVNMANESAPYLLKHPLFIFANPLPDWYFNLANKSDYNGCPNPDENLGLPNRFYTPPGWEPGQVVETKTYLDKNGILPIVIDTSGIREVHDLILKSYSKRLCIPGGVYVKGRIIHHNKYHTNHGLKLRAGDPNLSPGDSGFYNPGSQEYNNAKGVKIVGRGILSGIHMKYRADSKFGDKNLVDEMCKFEPKGGAGWNGHLIDIRHQGDNVFGTEVVEKDCYYRNTSLQGEDVNCVQGITMVDAPKASIFTGGSRIDVENVKIMSWHIQSNGIGSAKGSKIKNVFIKANDDSIVMGQSKMEVDNATVWRQKWGSVVNLSWKLKDNIEGSRLNGLNVIRFDKGQTMAGNGNAAIVSARHMMGGTIKDFTFKDIIVEDPPYEIINLQLNDERYDPDKRAPKVNYEDGTGKIEGIEFNGLFTPEPYNVKFGDDSIPSKIQKSVFSIFDKNFDEAFVRCEQECKQDCETEDNQICHEECLAKYDSICPIEQDLPVDDVCECPYNYNLVVNNMERTKKCVLIERSISSVQLNNICIGNEDDNVGITALNIGKYFEFVAGVNEIEPPSNLNEIISTGFSNISADLCPSLIGENMCTLENYRNLCL